MKKIIFSLIISLLLCGSVNAGSTGSMENGMYETDRQRPINNIYMEDMRWRFPDLKFIESGRFFTVIRKLDGVKVYEMEDGARATNIFGAFRQLSAHGSQHVDYMLSPVLPTILKISMDLSFLPIGFKILNPDDGLIEERWDGSKWLRPNQLSQRHWGHIGSVKGPVE